LRVKRGTA